MTEEPYSKVLYRTSLAGILLGVVASLYFVAGLFGADRQPHRQRFSSPSPLSLPRFIFSACLSGCRFTPAGSGAAFGFCCCWFWSRKFLCLVPPTARDELTHHLAIPRLYVRSGKIVEVPMALYSYYPMLLDMLYTPWVGWGYDSVPKLVHCLFGFLTGLILYAYLSRRMNAVYGLLGFFFFVTLPAVSRLSHWAYVDLGTAFYAAASLFCLLRWNEERAAPRWLILAAMAAGFCAATKPNGLLALFLLACVFLVLLARGERQPPIRILSQFAVFGLMAALPLAALARKELVADRQSLSFHCSGIFSREIPAQSKRDLPQRLPGSRFLQSVHSCTARVGGRLPRCHSGFFLAAKTTALSISTAC